VSDVPVLLIAFNRPDLLKKSLNSLLALGVRKLWVHLDAPRPGIDEDYVLVSQCKDHLDFFEGSFESLMVNYREVNLGCKLGPISAIDWFFSHVESGIILEDDIEISSNFINFATKGLQVFEHVDDVWMINGWSPFNDREVNIDMWLSRYPVPWGWATWKSRWNKSDFESNFESASNILGLKTISGTKVSADFNYYWSKAFQEVADGFDAWDYEWFHEMWFAGGYALTPTFRLTANIGFGAQATHTEIPVGRAASPISSNFIAIETTDTVEMNFDLDLALDKLMFGMQYPSSEFKNLTFYLNDAHLRTLERLLLPRFGVVKLIRTSYMFFSQIPGFSKLFMWMIRHGLKIPLIAKLERIYKSRVWFL
jgi:hypothetical protein